MQHVDLHFLGTSQIIATAVLTGPDGVTLVDPGPASCLPVLERGLRELGTALSEVRRLLLTHIHLDHAGASGTIVARQRDVEVFVHERGAPHLIDPARLMDSATRIYGDDMERLWGEMRPLPRDNVRVVRGGERVHVAGHDVEVVYTPGHASHHVAFVDRDEGVAYMGDLAGIRRRPSGFVVPPTPPPDIDLDVWRESLAQVQSRNPAAYFITHFGLWNDPGVHADQLLAGLDAWSVRVRDSLNEAGTDESRAARFAEWVRADLLGRLTPEEADRYERAGRFDFSWQGLARYWRKQLKPA